MSIKIEVGKSYRTRDGRKIGPLEYTSLAHDGFVAKARVGGRPVWFSESGIAEGAEKDAKRPNLDLIAEWVEPDDGWGEWTSASEWDVSKHDVQMECIDGIHRVRKRPRKPVVETRVFYWNPDKCASPGYCAHADKTHTITLTKKDGVWQRDAVLEEIK